MKGKMLVLIAAVSFLLIPALAAAQTPRMSIWTDKPEYAPGETGTLYFVFYNEGGSAVTINRITIVFTSWRAYINGKWEGNETMDITPPQGIASKGLFQNNTKFTVPSDGRAQTTDVLITIEIAEGGDIHGEQMIAVTTNPRYADQIVTLFTVQVVLIIVCTAILAATMFLSARRPTMMWSKEAERAQ